ncbi:MAG: hypothetical protein ACLGP3_06175, partial [Acidobacteriota bacterium]
MHELPPRATIFATVASDEVDSVMNVVQYAESRRLPWSKRGDNRECGKLTQYNAPPGLPELSA